ncbi:MAG: rhomboid family intramembrane serine protease, partial [Odoribacter sp.]|nr:rhomboid family intramembrane serine protease [Odoribacter sp.]
MYYGDYRGNGYHAEGFGQKIRSVFRQGSSLTRLIYINCGIFLALKVAYTFFLLTGAGRNFYPGVLEWLG